MYFLSNGLKYVFNYSFSSFLLTILIFHTFPNIETTNTAPLPIKSLQHSLIYVFALQ